MPIEDDFADYEAIINEASNPLKSGYLSPKTIVWKKRTNIFDPNGEDPQPGWVITTLKCLPNYNELRTWPATIATETGEIDKQSVQIFLNKEYLATLHLINAHGYFEYNPDIDIFVMDGLAYKAEGDTASAPSVADDLFITIVLKRDTTTTGDRR